MTESETLGTGEHPPPYIIFLVVFLFFLTGLLGFLICHLLKKKGYHCRTDVEDEEEEEKLGENADDDDDENQDTVEQILKCIIENEANMEAFNEMLGNHNVCVRHDRRLRKESIGGIPPHLHTVHSGTDHNSCHLCAQIKSKKGRRQSRILRTKQRPGEQTVFSVGRFRVTHTDKRSHGGSNPMAISGDQLDQSQDSEDRKDGGYNLRSMFKEVRQPSESASGVFPNAGRQKKSVTIFGLRRGSDPVGIKVGEGTGWDIGGVKSALQQQPAVLGEPLPAENIKVDPKRAIKADSKLETELETELQHETETSDSLNSPSSQGKKEACHSSDGSEKGTKLGLTPESGTKIIFQSSSGSTAASAPSSLPIPLEKRVNVDDMWIKPESGPLQTSTPIVPMPTSIPGFTPVIHTGQLDTYSSTDFPAIQTLSDQSLPVRTPSSISSLKTPTSPLAMTASPKLASRNMPSEVAKAEFPQALTPSPKHLHRQEMSRQSPVSNSSFRQSSSPLQARSLERELEVATLPKAEEKLEFKRPGILKNDKLLPIASGEFKGSALSPPSDFKDRCSSLPLSPSSLSPSSPQGGRISSVTIVKASPDSQREFSVVTMVEEEKSTTEDQKEDNSELGAELEKRVIGSAYQEGDVFLPGVRQPESQSGETSGVEVIPSLSQEKDDMVEMEDIRDCKVMLVEGAQRMEEEVETKIQTQVEKD